MKVGIISAYPLRESKHGGQSGVASYTKNLIISLLNNCSVIVFANRMPNVKHEYFEDASVYRCWNKGILHPFQIFRTLLNKKLDIVHVQHETYLFGDLGSSLLFPLLLILIKLLRCPVIVTLHGVVPLSRVNRSFLRENWVGGAPTIMKTGLFLLMRIIVLLSTAIVVHEEKSKERMVNEYGCDARKIHVIHHGVEERGNSMPQDEAKEELGFSGKKIILFFGYITGYKNVELLIDSAKFLQTPDCVIVIAGGPHPRLRSNPNYCSYLSYLHQKGSVVSKDRLQFRGFVPEESVSLYFSAADLAVFPYTVDMSSSGPMCLAISHRTPFLVSRCFSQIINDEELVFRLNPSELARCIGNFLDRQDIRRRALENLERIAVQRSWDSVSRKTIDLYEGTIQ